MRKAEPCLECLERRASPGSEKRDAQASQDLAMKTDGSGVFLKSVPPGGSRTGRRDRLLQACCFKGMDAGGSAAVRRALREDEGSEHSLLPFVAMATSGGYSPHLCVRIGGVLF